MKRNPFFLLISAVVVLLFVFTLYPASAAAKTRGQQQKDSRPVLPVLAQTPYGGAIVMDAATGKVLFEENADARAYPASIAKLMTFLVISDAIRAKQISLADQVTVSAEASKIGGSQVYLKEGEVFTVDELLYALIVQSANDAAVALAQHLAGTRDAFVDLMNKRAKELGMTHTEFHSVHGLPPGRDQLPDVSTPRDVAMLCRELVRQYPEVLKYTSTKERPFRPDTPKPFIMRNHNHLLGHFAGCDGFKTGYFRAAGFSIAATAQKNGNRVIAVVMGSVHRQMRDARTRDLLAKGLMMLASSNPQPAKTPAMAVATASPQSPAPPASATAPGPAKAPSPSVAAPAPAGKAASVAARTNPPEADDYVIRISKRKVKIVAGIAGGVIFLLLVILLFRRSKPNRLGRY